MADIFASVRAAYSPDYDVRSLQFTSPQAYNVEQLQTELPEIVDRYNRFNAAKVTAWLVKNTPSVAVWVAREYSVALYIQGTELDLAKIRRAASRLGADEADLLPGNSKTLSGKVFTAPSLRLWWD